MPRIKVLRFTLICLLALVMPRGAVVAQTFSDRAVTQAVLLERYSKDPRALAIAVTRANGTQAGLSGSALRKLVDDYAKQYDDLASLYKLGELPLDSRDRAIMEITKAAYTFVLTETVPVVGPVIGKLLDEGFKLYESDVALEASATLGESFAHQQYQAVVNGPKAVDLILNTPGMRDFVVQNIGVDINKPWQDQIQQNPSVGAMFFARDAVTGVQANGRLLMDIMNDVQALDENDELRKQELEAELNGVLQEGFQSVSSQLSDGVARLAQQQELFQQELLDRSLAIEGAIGENREILTAFIEDQAERELARWEAELDAAEQAEKAAELNAYFQISAWALDQIEPGLGNKVSVVATSSVQILNAIAAFEAAGAGWSNVAQLATGMGNPALAIFSVMQATGPSADEMILQQLAQIGEMIQDLRAHMDERFDAIDAKLDRLESMLIGIETNLRLLSLQIDLNLEVASRDLQVGLDTQSLLIAMTQKLHVDIRNIWFVPCIERASNLPLPDEKFIECVSYLYNYAMTLGQLQTVLDPDYDPLTLANHLNKADRTSLDILKKEFESRSGASLPIATMIPPEAWRTTVGWHRDFLKENIEKTRELILPRVSGMRDLALTGRRLASSLDVMLRSFEGGACMEMPNLEIDADHLCQTVYQPVCGCNGRTYTNACFSRLAGVIRSDEGMCESLPGKEFSATGAMIQAGWDAYKRVVAAINRAVDDYAEETQFKTDAKSISLSSTELPLGLPAQVVLEGDLAQSLTLASIDAVVTALPPAVVALSNAGMGTFSIRIRCDYLGYARYIVIVHFNSAAGSDALLSRSFANIRLPFVDNHGCQPDVDSLTPAEFDKWLNVQVPHRAQIIRFDGDVGNWQQQLVSSYENHRSKIAKSILTTLKFPNFDDAANLENAFFGSLIRLVLARSLSASDALLGFASGTAGIPLASDFAKRVDEIVAEGGEAHETIVYKVDDFFFDELTAMTEYLNSEEIARQAAVARLDQLVLSDTATDLETAGLLLVPEPDAALLMCTSALVLAAMKRWCAHARNLP